MEEAYEVDEGCFHRLSHETYGFVSGDQDVWFTPFAYSGQGRYEFVFWWLRDDHVAYIIWGLAIRGPAEGCVSTSSPESCVFGVSPRDEQGNVSGDEL